MAQDITQEIENEAAIYAEGTPYTKSDILRAYRAHLANAEQPLNIQGFCETELGIKQHRYSVAFVKADGSWDIVQAFTADNHDAANSWAETHYAEQEWYVLDANGRNINGGIDG